MGSCAPKRACLAPLDVVFSDYDIVEPDLLYVSRERAADVLVPAHVRGTPNLVIEIASKGTRKRDETIKRGLYERAGVDEYWVVDPEIDVVRVYRGQDGGFGRALELRRDTSDTLTTGLLPGLEVSLPQSSLTERITVSARISGRACFPA